MKLIGLYKYLVAVSLLIASVSVQAGLINGDFSASPGWTGVADGLGSASVVGGEGVLETGAGIENIFGSGNDLYALLQGDDGSFSFGSPITLAADISTLSFYASFIDLGVDSTEDGSLNFRGFVDTLYISLYDSTDPSSLSDLFLSGSDSSINTGEIDYVNDGLGFLSFSFDVSSMAGKDIALSFELYDEDDGFNSKVLIDNVAFNTASVPEPSMLSLLSLGLLIGWVGNHRKRKRIMPQ